MNSYEFIGGDREGIMPRLRWLLGAALLGCTLPPASPLVPSVVCRRPEHWRPAAPLRRPAAPLRRRAAPKRSAASVIRGDLGGSNGSGSSDGSGGSVVGGGSLSWTEVARQGVPERAMREEAGALFQGTMSHMQRLNEINKRRKEAKTTVQRPASRFGTVTFPGSSLDECVVDFICVPQTNRPTQLLTLSQFEMFPP
jgi:hypothetical protein